MPEHPVGKVSSQMIALRKAIELAQQRLLYRANSTNDDLHLSDGMSDDNEDANDEQEDDQALATPQDFDNDDNDDTLSGAEAAPASLHKTTASFVGMPSSSVVTISKAYEVCKAGAQGVTCADFYFQVVACIKQENDDGGDNDDIGDNGARDDQPIEEPLSVQDQALLALRE
jgi:hypothetical protein